MLKSRSNAAINHIKIDDPGNPEKTILITDRDKMEEMMMTAFKKKITKVYDTPIVHEPFLSIIGEDGLLSDAGKVLLGINFIKPCIHPNILEVSKALKMDKAIKDNKEIKTYTNLPSFRAFEKKIKT